MANGILIAIEGIDNSGKTALLKDLVACLKKSGLNAVAAQELCTPVGPIISAFFEGRKPFSPLLKTLFFAVDRAILVEDLIAPALSKGSIVIADRYYYSALAYRRAEDFDLDYVRSVNNIFPKPDLTLLIDVDPAESERRGFLHNKKTPYSIDCLSKVRKAYLDMASKEGFIVIDGMCNLAKLKAKVREQVFHYLSNRTPKREVSE